MPECVAYSFILDFIACDHDMCTVCRASKQSPLIYQHVLCEPTIFLCKFPFVVLVMFGNTFWVVFNDPYGYVVRCGAHLSSAFLGLFKFMSS